MAVVELEKTTGLRLDPLERLLQGAPGGERLDQVVDRVAAAQPARRSLSHCDRGRGRACGLGALGEQQVGDAPAQRRAQRDHQQIGHSPSDLS